MIVINACFSRGRHGTQTWEMKTVTGLGFVGVPWDEIKPLMIRTHIKTVHLINEGWRLEGYARVDGPLESVGNDD